MQVGGTVTFLVDTSILIDHLRGRPEANAWLAADRMGTTACLRLATQDYVLRCVMPLGDATNGAALLRHLAVQARAVLSMREQIIPVLAPGPQGGMGADFS